MGCFRREAGCWVGCETEGQRALRAEPDQPLVPTASGANELAHRQAIEELVGEDDGRAVWQRIGRVVPRRAAPGEAAFLRFPQYRARLDEMRCDANIWRGGGQGPQRICHERAASRAELGDEERFRSAHGSMDIGRPGPDQFPEHLRDFGGGGEVATRAQGVPGTVIAVDRMAQAERHIAVDPDGTGFADDGRDLAPERRHAPARVACASSTVSAAAVFFGRVRPVAASTI